MQFRLWYSWRLKYWQAYFEINTELAPSSSETKDIASDASLSDNEEEEE